MKLSDLCDRVLMVVVSAGVCERDESCHDCCSLQLTRPNFPQFCSLVSVTSADYGRRTLESDNYCDKIAFTLSAICI